MWRFLIGEAGYLGNEANLRWFSGELTRLRLVDRLKDDAMPEVFEAIRAQIHSAWLDRLKEAESNPNFWETGRRAEEALAAPSRRGEPKACLAEAYLVLTKPEGTECFDPPENPGPEIAYLKKVGCQINTRTVRQYAQMLWREYRSEILGAKRAQQYFDFTVDHIHWSRLFDELGLTEQFLPRDSGGRPQKVRQRKNF
jgi:hypothetical protein